MYMQLLSLMMFVIFDFFLGVGRYRNESYGEFLRALNSAKRLNTRIGPREVHKIDTHVNVGSHLALFATGEADWNQWL